MTCHPWALAGRNSIHSIADSEAMPGVDVPDLKQLYRKLARRYHPDLARNAADRLQSNTQMAEINQAYADGDLAKLMNLAGIATPYGVELPPSSIFPGILQNKSLSETEKIELQIESDPSTDGPAEQPAQR